MLILQVCSGLIGKWKHEFIFNGVEGLKLAYQGSRGYFSPEEKQQVLAWLKEKNSWNLKELEFYIASEYLEKVNQGRSKKEWLVKCIRLAPNAPEQNPIEDVWLQGKEMVRKYWHLCQEFQIVNFTDTL